jgi:hypothetical protein
LIYLLTKSYSIKNFILVFTFFLLFQYIGFSQILTRILPEKESIEKYLPTPVDDQVFKHYQEPVDFEKILNKDKQNGRKMSRATVNIPVNYNLDHGEFKYRKDGVTWSIEFETEKAKSLSFHFDDLYLPDGAEMFIYSRKSRMIQGPITNKHVHDGDLASELIKGTNATITVFLGQSQIEDFNLKIISVNHGVPMRKSSARFFGAAGDCNFDIGCSIRSTWGSQSDAVARMLNGTGGACSGALINNDCSDMTPFFLTADHCISGNLNLYAFRFHYEATSPTCPGNSTGEDVSQYVTFTGAFLRSSDDATDFALLEFKDPIIGTEGLAVAGWNRSTTAATSGASIHHPSNDAKKITLYNTTADRDDNYTLTNGTDVVGDLHWVVDWSTGVTENGSSGSPLFDQNKRIVGQLAGGNAICNGATLDDGYGRFDNSWTGNGTNNTRLSNWLGDGTPPTITNTVRVPYINYSGNEFVCSSNKTFTLVNTIPGRSTAWSVSPSNLVNVSSGSGSTATIRAKTSYTGGEATLTFTLSKSGCDPVVITEELYIGKPSVSSSSMNGQSPVSLVAIAIGSPTSYSWTKVTGTGNIYPNNNTCQAYNTSYMVVNASATNTCGTKSIKDFYLQSSGWSQIIINNPTQDVFYVDIGKLAKSKVQVRNIIISGEKNNYLRRHKYIQDGRDKLLFNLEGQMPGIYFIQIETDRGIITEKIVKI